jgi:hypothetical protein
VAASFGRQGSPSLDRVIGIVQEAEIIDKLNKHRIEGATRSASLSAKKFSVSVSRILDALRASEDGSRARPE